MPELEAKNHPVEIDDGVVEEIVLTTWATLCDLPLKPEERIGFDGEATVTGCVQIDGAWEGAVLIQCPLALASELTARMFQCDEPVDLADVRDVVGELTNIVAGNVKSMLPERSHISLPAVAVGADHRFSVVGTRSVNIVSLSSDGRPVLVTVVKRCPPSNGDGS